MTAISLPATEKRKKHHRLCLNPAQSDQVLSLRGLANGAGIGFGAQRFDQVGQRFGAEVAFAAVP
jgi:hypothetical protein